MHPDHITSSSCAPTEIERWLPVAGWPAYDVSDWGRLRSYYRWRKELGTTPKIIKGGHWPWGYIGIKLTQPDSDQRRHVAIHILVLEAFKGPRPDGMEACHGDSDPKNNRLDNLRWDTPRNNSLDKLKIGRCWQLAKLTESDIPAIWERLVQGHNIHEIAADYGVQERAIRDIRSEKCWSHITRTLSGVPVFRNKQRKITSYSSRLPA